MTENAQDNLQKKVEDVIEQIRPSLQADGGDIELIGIEDNVVKVRLQGACRGCPMAAMTLQMNVERVLRQEIPEIKGVENVTD